MLDGPILTDREVSARYARVADQDNFEGILEFSDYPLVSTDIQNSPHSCIVGSDLTMANGKMVKVFGWYDNESGDSNSCPLVDVTVKVAQTVPAAVA